MPDIRYVCLSDLHFGAESSLLSALRSSRGVDVDRVAPTLTGLVDCLGELISKNEDRSVKPTLVLCGDILELALSVENVPAMVFERFVDLAFPDGGRLFDATIYFVPGNHDHHLWEGSRQRQYADYVRQQEKADAHLEPPWHTTRMLGLTDPDPVDTVFLNALVRRSPGRADMCVRAVYPNLAIPSADGRRWVVCHHGHFVESLYRAMSVVRDLVFPGRTPPAEVWDWEAENFAWIDFLWSALGRSGDVGESLEVGYDSLKSERAMRRLVSNLATGLAARRRAPGPARVIESRVLELVLQKLVRRIAAQERRDPTVALTPRAEKGLQLYLEGPLRSQIVREAPGNRPPEEVTFVFGHTHKPFSTRRDASGYERTIDVYNTGGWVIDTPRPAPMQGAAAVLLDEDLNAASLRLFNQSADGRPGRVHVQDPGVPGANAANPFVARLAATVDPDAQPWSGFSTTVAEAVSERRRRLSETLAELERPPTASEQPAWT